VSRDRARVYSTRIIKGGALIADMRLLTAAWDGQPGCAERLLERGVLSHLSRKRADDVIREVFIPRFVRSEPSELWEPLATLERAGWGLDRIRPIHYYAAAWAEPLLADVVLDLLEPRYAGGTREVEVGDTQRFLAKAPAERFPAGRWPDAIDVTGPPHRETASTAPSGENGPAFAAQ
jgi:hypothetical protein